MQRTSYFKLNFARRGQVTLIMCDKLLKGKNFIELHYRQAIMRIASNGHVTIPQVVGENAGLLPDMVWGGANAFSWRVLEFSSSVPTFSAKAETLCNFAKGNAMGRLLKLGVLWQFLKREAAMVWLLLRNPRAPLAAKVVAVAAALYLFSPLDIVTDLIPILGWIDDAIIVSALLSLAYRLLPVELYESLKRQATNRSGAAPAA